MNKLELNTIESVHKLFNRVTKPTRCKDYWPYTTVMLQTDDQYNLLVLVKALLENYTKVKTTQLLFVHDEEISKLDQCTNAVEELIWSYGLIPLVIKMNDILRYQLLEHDPIEYTLREKIKHWYRNQDNIVRQISKHPFFIIITAENLENRIDGNAIMYDFNQHQVGPIIITAKKSISPPAHTTFTNIKQENKFISSVESLKYFDNLSMFILIIILCFSFVNILIMFVFIIYTLANNDKKIKKNKSWKQFILLLIICNIIFQVVLILLSKIIKEYKIIAILNAIINIIFLFLYINWYDIHILNISSIQTLNFSYILFNGFMSLFFITKKLMY